jgi:predicted nucleic acid-binding protein
LAFVRDVADGRYGVEWGEERDLARAREILDRYRRLGMGLVDGVVIAVAERLGVSAIATLDIHHFGAVRIEGAPKLLPRDR